VQELIVVLLLTAAKCSKKSQKHGVGRQTYRHSTSSSSLSRVSKAEYPPALKKSCDQLDRGAEAATNQRPNIEAAFAALT
jgi:hypothetical protein